jgi:2,3-bisphosphoglycerate-dependent phosphoglycerate mutase
MPVEIVFETDALTDDKERGIATGWLPGRLRPRGRTNAVAMCDGAATTFTSHEARVSVLSFDSTGDD